MVGVQTGKLGCLRMRGVKSAWKREVKKHHKEYEAYGAFEE